MTMKQSTRELVEGNWKQFRGRIKEAWGAVTDDDLQRVEGRYEQLLGMLEERTGRDRAEIERKLEDMTRELEAHR